MKEDYMETFEQLDGNSEMKSLDQEDTCKSFKCNTCGKYLETEDALIFHVAKQHNKASQFTCTFCGEGFVTKNNYHYHTEYCPKRTEL